MREEVGKTSGEGPKEIERSSREGTLTKIVHANLCPPKSRTPRFLSSLDYKLLISNS